MRLTLALALLGVVPAQPADQKVLLFINRTYISRPYIAKRLAKSCPEVRITQDAKRAQFRMDHDLGHGGWMGNDISLYDKSGDLITTVYAKKPQNAIKDLCAAIEAAAH
jgi:phage/plasmid primase-like uncharacterized protein